MLKRGELVSAPIASMVANEEFMREFRNLSVKVDNVNVKVASVDDKVSSVNVKVASVSAQVANLKVETVAPTTTALAIDMLKFISSRNLEIGFDRVGDAVLNDDQYGSLQSIFDEHDLIVELTEHLEGIFRGFAVVNSEVYPWLVTGICHPKMKPDLFVCPISFYTKHRPNSGKKFYPEKYRYGTVEDTRLYGGVVVLDCKLTWSNKAFGELCTHLAHLGQGLQNNTTTSGMLLTKTGFALLEQLRGVPLRYLTGNWNEPGSLQAIRSFFEPTLGPFREIDNLCHSLGVVALDPQSCGSDDCGFLGQGAFGRVIRVLLESTPPAQARKRDVFAMKIMENTTLNWTQLEEEYSRLKRHSVSCGCTLIARAVSEFRYTSNLCGFLIQPVGAVTCTRDMIFAKHDPSLKQVLLALYRLHKHPPPIFHGDARLPNLIMNDTTLTWIDLRDFRMMEGGPETWVHNFAYDMTSLVTSLCPSLVKSDVGNLRQLITSYSEGPTEGTLDALGDYLLINNGDQ